MKVILQQDVPEIGRKYEVKNVADGFAMNYLLPKKLALFAAESLVVRARKEQEVREEALYAASLKLAAQIKGLHNKSMKLEVSASEAGGLFAGLDAKTIAVAINKEFKVSLEVEQIELEKPIKETGQYEIPVSVGEFRAKIFLTVVAKQDK